MKTISQNIYEFSELSEKVQSKVLDNMRDLNVHHEWYDCIFTEFVEKAKKECFVTTEKEIFFSGFSSQGDGACFDGTINLEKFIEENPKYKSLKDNAEFSIVKNSYANHYSHSRTRYILCDFEYHGGLANEAKTILEELYLKLCNELYRELESTYEDLTSDEEIKESILSNEYMFYSDGRIYNELKE